MHTLKTWTVYAVDFESIKAVQQRRKSYIKLSDDATLPGENNRFELITPKGRVTGNCKLPLVSFPFETAMRDLGGHLSFEGTFPGIKVFACDPSGRKTADFSKHFNFSLH
jgi:hypothetical protein